MLLVSGIIILSQTKELQMTIVFVLEYTMLDGYTFILGDIAYQAEERAQDTADHMMKTGKYKSVIVKHCTVLS